MNIKIDQIFSTHFSPSQPLKGKAFRRVSANYHQTSKPFDLSTLSQDPSSSTRFEAWIKGVKAEQTLEQQAIQQRLDELLKSPLPLQNFELVCAYKSPKSTFQAPVAFWIENEKTAPQNPLLLETLLYERIKEEVFAVKVHKKSTLPFNLKLKGRLLMNQHGYFYLKLKDSFFEGFQRNIKTFGGEKPPFLERTSTLGYHLGVIMPREYTAKRLWGKIKEVGKEFYLVIQGCYQIHLHDHPEYEKLWVLKAECPPLEDLRSRYGLSPKLNGHDFMLVLGVKKRDVNNPHQSGFMRINPTIYPM